MIDPQELDPFLDEFLDLSESERPAFIEKLRSVRPELADEIQRLWANMNAQPSLLDRTADLPLIGHQEDADTSIPTELGAYRVLREIGQGGMGRVFLAERADGQFTREVAVKFIRIELSRSSDRLRFEHERNIMAQLSHPNIAQLQDSGITDEGHPYFIMEYVQGTPILIYCDQRLLSVSARLKLFSEVCGAVQYAHEQLVVHRDLKSNNILVTGDGEIKLLDFGIAKVLQEQDGDSVYQLTQTGNAVFTPECASPEQVIGESVTPATDIYALGVLLYRMLCGRPPLKLPHAFDPSFMHVILNDEPSRPSQAALQTDDLLNPASHADQIAKNRQVSPNRLSRILKGDLDKITLKCLRKEKRARYGSVAALQADIERYRLGLPISARSSNWRYQTVKFVHRNRWLLAMGCTALMALIGYAVIVTVMTQKVSLERDRAREVSAFLGSMLETADPHLKGRDATVADFLDGAAESLSTKYLDRPDLKGSLHRIIGTTYRGLSDYKPAKQQLEKSLEYLTESDPFGAEWFDCKLEVASITMEMGDIQGAISTLDQLGPQLEYHHPRDKMLRRKHRLIQILGVSQTGDWDKSMQLVRALEDELGDEPHDDVAQIKMELAQRKGSILIWDRRPDEAAAAYREALEIAIRVFGESHVNTLECETDLAGALMRATRYREAKDLLQSAIPKARLLLGDNHFLTIDAIFRAGILHSREKDFQPARLLLSEARDRFAQAFDSEHHTTSAARSELATVLHQTGYLFEAESEFSDLYRIRCQQMGASHPNTLVMMQRLAAIYTDLGDYVAAEDWLCNGITIAESSYPADHHLVLRLKRKLATTYQQAGRFDQAHSLLKEIYPLLLARQSWSRDVLSVCQALIDAYLRSAQTSEAKALLHEMRDAILSLEKPEQEIVAWCDETLTRIEQLHKGN